MFNKLYVVVAETEEDVYRMVRIATNHRLYVTYKIGVYGNERQHELFIIGKPWHYHKFKNAIKTPITKGENKEGGVH
ncbi:MAG: hypothetical protein J6Q60_05450 [Bacteroidaceae bacterium]|nr:hypothetical protein [Bacteroidaceae bacterium]